MKADALARLKAVGALAAFAVRQKLTGNIGFALVIFEDAAEPVCLSTLERVPCVAVLRRCAMEMERSRHLVDVPEGKTN